MAQAGLIAAGAVGRLPLLTELRLAGICQACWPEEAGTVHGEALALHALPQLQRLFIGGGGGSCSMTEPAQLLGALASLTWLTYLGLCCCGFYHGAVGDLIPELWALTELKLHAVLVSRCSHMLTCFAVLGRRHSPRTHLLHRLKE